MSVLDNAVFWWGEPISQLKQAVKENKILRVWVAQLGKEGDEEVAILNYNNIQGKCYASDFDKHEFSTIKGFVGHQVDVIVKSVDEENKTFMASRKEADLIRARITMKKLKEGTPFKGTISGWNPSKNTIFVDIGGIDGFCYLEDWSHNRLFSVQEAGFIGEPVDVVVKSIIKPEDLDKQEAEKGKARSEQFIRLSKKDLIVSPWTNAETKYPEGNITVAKVVNVDSSKNNIFVELEKGLTILARVPKNSNLPMPIAGQPVRGKIVRMDSEKERGLLMINGYPHGIINKRETLGSFIFG